MPSQSNFLFVRHETYEGRAIFGELRERGILVRHFDKEALSDFLRISIGTEDEMDSLIEALEAVCR